MKLPFYLDQSPAWRFLSGLAVLLAGAHLVYAPVAHFAVSGVANSADGTKLVLVGRGPIYLSSDSGTTGAPDSSTANIWQAVAASADGTRIVAAATFFHASSSVVGDGLIYRSGDSGASWMATSAPSNQWASVVSSADGRMLAAAASGGTIYSSRDAGATWLRTSAPSNAWASLACSADGARLVAAGQQIYTSIDSGATWMQTSAPSNAWTAVASSADGTRLLAAAGSAGTGLIYVSRDSGASWITTTAPSNNWASLAASAEWTRLVAAEDNGIFTSTDCGTTWTVVPGSVDIIHYSAAVASSADGGRVVVAYTYPNYRGAPFLFTLPYLGPWRLVDLPAQSWDSIVSSSDGRRLVASGKGVVYSSADSGATWLALTNTPGNVMAASTNGTTLVAGVSGGPIYISGDAGATWLPTSAPSNDWVSVACSADATKLVAATGSGLLLTSTDAGATWGTNFAVWEWGSVASSADGTKFVAAALSGYADLPTDSFIWVSTNSGVSWNLTGPPNGWSSVAMSADGTHLVAVAAADSGGISWWHPDGLIYLSHDGGITWTNAPALVNDWTSVAMSSDGAKLVAAGFDAVYISTDYGATWAAAAAPFASWKALTCSADGSQIAGVGNGVVAILRPLAPAHLPPPLPRLTMGLSSTSASLSWLVASSRFVLQQSAELTSTNWVDVTNQPSLNYTILHNEVTVPRRSSNSFYRLKQQ